MCLAYHVLGVLLEGLIFQNNIHLLVIDEGISLAHLKGTLEVFVRHMLGEDSKLRFRVLYIVRF